MMRVFGQGGVGELQFLHSRVKCCPILGISEVGILNNTSSISISLPHSRHSSSSLRVRASDATAPYPDNSVDARPREQEQKKRKIAGVDQDQLLDPALLADPDSCFCEFKGVTIHHKLYSAESHPHDSSSSQAEAAAALKLPFPIILLHGFGASVFSWNRVMKPLAQLTASKVLAFDRPAFGLTSRLLHFDATPLNPYSMAFSVLATLYFIDFLAADKAVLVGHSAGSLVAADTYFEAPERVAALILVAPAILAPNNVHKGAKGNKLGKHNQAEGEQANSDSLGKPFIKLLKILSKFTSYIAHAVAQMLTEMLDLVNSLYRRALSAILRSTLGIILVRIIIDKFGILAVRNAWYNSKLATEHVLNGYTKPLRAKGWDRALAEFTAATLANTESEKKPPLSKRLHEITCPVLIVTGDNDRIVPSWNARKLSQAIPGSHFEVIKHCGHLPHEEKVEEFVSIVDKFLKHVFGDAKELSLQAVV